ncbi:MAG: hypothetical protein SOY43_01135, partial [Parabacteroides sp.]|nr:hypothetical protein [bacterium]MDY4101485.1 hypothetical protein [Parabacteroides sp.]
RNGCCLSEASFIHFPPAAKRSSPDGAALTFWFFWVKPKERDLQIWVKPKERDLQIWVKPKERDLQIWVKPKKRNHQESNQKNGIYHSGQTFWITNPKGSKTHSQSVNMSRCQSVKIKNG